MQCQKLKTYMETGRVIFLSVKSIRPNPSQPRRIFSQDALSELADSIRQHGVLQPLSVRRVQGGYELIAGERRLRAAQLAGLGEVPCLVMQMDDKESGLAAMIENLQRQDLDFVEEAQGIAALMRAQNLSQEQTARLLGKSQSAVANKLRLLRHSQPVLNALRAGNLTERHARALLRLGDAAQRQAALRTVLQQRMSVAETEGYVETLLRPPERRELGALLSEVRRLLDAGACTDAEESAGPGGLSVTLFFPANDTFP